jgi:hypothetical protein
VQLPRLPLPGPRLVRPLSAPLSASLSTLAGLAAFIRDRLDALAPVWPRHDLERPALDAGGDGGSLAVTQAATAIVTAAAPFAPTSFARARLLRQMHACGLLTPQESARAEALLGVAQSG